jgi:adenosylcobinamide-GDP ribazoletransferase
MLRTLGTHLCTALTFLTRLPLVARCADPRPQALAHSAYWWPVIGAAIGLLLAVVLLTLAKALGTWVAVWLTLTVGLLLTGGFHEDGLADSFDGLWGGFSPQRRLEIMRDSRIGSYGALALICLLGVKASALHTLAAHPAYVLALLPCAHALARLSALILARWLPYVRDDAHNKPVAQGISWGILTLGLSLTLLLCGLALLHFLPVRSAISIGFLLLGSVASCTLIWGLVLRAKIGGISGDTLGALNQLCEVLVLLCGCAMLRTVLD